MSVERLRAAGEIVPDAKNEVWERHVADHARRREEGNLPAAGSACVAGFLAGSEREWEYRLSVGGGDDSQHMPPDRSISHKKVT